MNSVVGANGKITMVRGDTIKFKLFINKGTYVNPERYVLQTGDKVYLGIMEANKDWEEGIVRKVYTNANLDEDDNVVIKLTATDTENLLPGRYFYQIKLLFTDADNDEAINTLVDRTEFYINE